MKKTLSILFCLVLCMGILAGCGNSATTEPKPSDKETSSTTPDDTGAWPEKAIEILIPYSAGGDSDTYLRAAAPILSRELGVDVVVSNVTGSGAAGAYSQALKSKNDGYTILYYNSSQLASQVTDEMGGISLTEDFLPGGSIVKDPNYSVMVRAESGWETMDDMLAEAKTNPDFKFASNNNSTVNYLIGLIEESPKVDFTIPQVLGAEDAAGLTLQLLSKEVDVIIGNYGNFIDYCAEGTLKCLGLLAEERNPAFPEIPTLKEQGFDVVYPKVYSFRFPLGTDEAVIAKFNEAMQAVVADPSFKEVTDRYGSVPTYQSPEDHQAWELEEIERESQYLHPNH